MQFDPTKLTFDQNGLIPCIAQDHVTGEVLMLAWMNAAALEQTIVTEKMTYWSRSRQELWVKGDSSGHRQRMIELRLDCDSDCLLAIVEQIGPACHTNRKSCFFTRIAPGAAAILTELST